MFDYIQNSDLDPLEKRFCFSLDAYEKSSFVFIGILEHLSLQKC